MKAELTRRKKMANQYLGRINLAVDYIEENLAKEFKLDEIAAVAGFSKYHFHRIFHSFTGETLFQFIQRLRLEKAATILLYDHGKTITEIALECGFANSSSFAKSFKQHFDHSASKWRTLGYAVCMQDSNAGVVQSKIRHSDSNPGEDILPVTVYIEYVDNTQIWRYELVNQS